MLAYLGLSCKADNPFNESYLALSVITYLRGYLLFIPRLFFHL